MTTKAQITKVHEIQEKTVNGELFYKYRLSLSDGENGRTGLKKSKTAYKEGQDFEYSVETPKGYKTLVEAKKPYQGGSHKDYKTEAVFIAFQCATQYVASRISQGQTDGDIKKTAKELLSAIDEAIGARK